VVTTTATLPSGDTSEFSHNHAVPLTSPENSPPVASFTASCTDLTCSFDASGSSDADGSVVRYDWNFGDGTTGTGQTSTRTYAAAGSYTVRLTVTDDRGATGTASTVVNLTAPAMRELVRDPFSRTVAEGWGTAGTGGTYSHSGGTAGMSVRSGVGLVVSSADNASRGARLPIQAVDQDLRVTVSGDQVPTGSGYTTQLVARTVAGSQEYRLRLRFSGNGQGYLTVMKRGTSSAEVAVGNEVAVPGLTHEVGAAYILRATVTGTSPTTLRMKAWRSGTTQPGWQLTRTDDEPALQAPGGAGVRTFMPTSMTNRPLTQRFDNFIVSGR
jgi:PKD repeat protein